MDNQEQLKKLANIFRTDSIITSQEIEQVLVGIMKIMASFKKGNEDLNTTTIQQVNDLLLKVQEENNKLRTDISEADEQVKQDFADKLKEAQTLFDKFMAYKPKDGEPGLDADEEKIVAEVLAQIKLPEYKEVILDNAGQIADKLESLKGEDRLDASAIKNLPEFVERMPIPNGGGWRNLFQLHDVSPTVPTNGQVLTYNSTTKLWTPSTGSGSGDMLAATYDPANIAEQLVGLTATQSLSNKTITAGTFATSMTGSYLTASEILITNASKQIVSAPVATYPSLTELTYLKGVTSAIQTQINAKGIGTVTSVSSANGALTVDTGTSTPVLTVNSAPILTTARTIGGVSFDGSANIVPQTIQSINEATDTTCFPLFITASGTQSLQPLNNAGFTYNSNTNALTATTFVGALTGNASTATSAATLTTPRTIGGISFDGSSNITVATATSGFTISGGNLVIDARNISTDGVTGTKFGTSATQKIGFFNATPIVQPTGDVITALQNLGLGASLTVLATTITSRTLWGQTYDGSGNVTGSLSAVGNITGGASSMTILAGTGASRTMIFQTTTAGSTATTALTLGADQSATFAGTVALGANSITMSGSIGVTGTRVTKGWFTDIESTNMPTVGGTAILTSLTAPQFTTIELGHATQNTLSASGGVLSIESVVIPTISSTNTLTNKYLTPQLQSVSDAGGTLTPVAITNDMVIATALTQATTIAAPTGSPVQGEKLIIRLKDNGTARALTWNAIYRVIGVTLPTTTVLSKTHYIGCVYNSTDTKWDVLAVRVEA